MTNEEMAALVQAGNREQLVPLWKYVRLLALKQAGRWVCRGVELEDLEQAAFLALLDAVRGFDGSAGCKFTTWFVLALKREFTASAGLRTERERRDPLRNSMSLDEPMTDREGDFSLADTLPDLSAEMAILEVDERDQQDRLRAAVAEVLAELPEKEREAVVGRYWYDQPVDSSAHAKAMRMLRHPSRSRRLKALM